ncbi:MAG: ThiF family adenylyltransferase [Candidatus Aenigmarchaeota archaeon]|nr:ThiF family adenylyltransferase [Candidatus Aenigmarchaeota archaeon]
MENRYSRQIAHLGSKKQEKIGRSSVCIIGCGALGSSSAELLTRAGVNRIKIVDRDFVELSNLQRQRLFDEDDIDKPKSAQLAEKLKKINSSIKIEFEITDFNPINAKNLIEGFDLVIDGLDNMSSRFLLNEVCVKLGVPWIYGSAIRNEGYASFIDPAKNCLKCFIKNAPSEIETCETSGVTNTITSLISAIQANEALLYLTGEKPPLSGRLLNANLKNMSIKNFIVEKDPACEACSLKKFDMLNRPISNTTALCGDNSYHIHPSSKIKLDLEGAKMRLPKGFLVKNKNEFLLRSVHGKKELTIFNDGRVISKNIDKSESEKIFKKIVLI